MTTAATATAITTSATAAAAATAAPRLPLVRGRVVSKRGLEVQVAPTAGKSAGIGAGIRRR